MNRPLADAFVRFAEDPANGLGRLAALLRSGGGGAEVSELCGGAAFFVACVTGRALKTRVLYVCGSDERAGRAREAVKSFCGAAPPDGSGLEFLARARDAPVVVTTLASVSEKTPSPAFLDAKSLFLRAGDGADRDGFVRRLEECGYKRRDFARITGEMSVRGAVVDVFRAGAERPLRVEFSGERVRSLRVFDPGTQVSEGRTDAARIFPVRAGGGEAHACIVDHLGKDPVIFIETEGAKSVLESLADAAPGGGERFGADEIRERISGARTVRVRGLGAGGVAFGTSPVKPRAPGAPAREMARAAEALKSRGYSVKMFLGSEAETEKMREIPGADAAELLTGSAGGGFVFPETGTAFVDGSDFAEKIPAVKKAEAPAGGKISSLGEISEGDFIVHREFGIGIFRGLKKMTVGGTAGDFMECEYRGGDRVYVPVSKFGLIHSYIAGGDAEPKPDRLGGAAWKKTVRGAKRAAETVARELLELYAGRQSGAGRAFSKADAAFREFEMDFGYEETPDQKKAIDEVMRDMESPRPMDRLICGDTGFGKTEVALRAALKAAMDGFQVAFIAPTTLLAAQHLETARRRLRKLPVRTVALSRFSSPKDERDALAEIERGTADIVIGTHKLLGNKVRFRNLGLLIIDEEHRFGVRHKEKLKTMKKNLDVLSLSATPIPRTLQLSLAGIWDVSAINSPPRGRLPVETLIRTWDAGLIRELILRETGRGGGVFFVHNRIESMDGTARRLAEIAPEVSMRTAHGRMGKRELAGRIEGFVRGEFQMLVTTAIVESGLDIARANTIIVNDAHTFGVADLYQLKGRVGRGREQGYACFLVPGEKTVGSAALKRLERFSELRDFGSGYRLALSDLRMRGVGNLFGVEQSGHVAGVGVEFYLEMLRETVERLKTGKTLPEVEPEIRTGINSRIPEDYIGNGGERLSYYRRISSSSTVRQVNGLRGEIRDRFGPVPDGLNNLLVFAAVKAVLKAHSVGLIEVDSDGATAFAGNGSPEARARFVRDGKVWTARADGGFPAEAADGVARLLSSLKPA